MPCNCEWAIAHPEKPALYLASVHGTDIFVPEVLGELGRLVKKGAISQEQAVAWEWQSVYRNFVPVWSPGLLQAVRYRDYQTARERGNVLVYGTILYKRRPEELSVILRPLRPLLDGGCSCSEHRLSFDPSVYAAWLRSQKSQGGEKTG